ncbi:MULTISPECIES: SDR family oxidoreductase [unclassified Streptomyces]|uniref:SDR family oxidoreductase n=1 Tax=unclassified Streptomyces TaxID=2593676 RepID=UPI000BF135DC|nr:MULTISPECIES: SDR family oxidoreductase [unclassified Streptomyces]
MTSGSDWPEFAGRSVLVTGGGRGIGKIISRAFASAGSHVFVNYFHSKAEALTTVEELRAEGLHVDLVRGSVTKPEHVRRILDEVHKKAGTLDILVNNAAFGRLRSTPELSERDWRRTWEVCVQAGIDVSLQAAAYMNPDGRAAIVNMSSIGASMVLGNYAAVGVSKAAVESATRYLAVELAPRGIRVNCASGGIIDSPVFGLFPDHEELREVLSNATPLGRMGIPDEYVELVLFLASRRSGWITGQTVLADGGLSLGAHLLTPPAYRAPTPQRRDADPAPGGLVDAPETAGSDVGEGIAIVGMGAVTPGAGDAQQLWELLSSGGPVFREPGDRWRLDGYYSADPNSQDKCYAPALGFISTTVDSGTRGEDYTTTWLRRALEEAWEGHSPEPKDKVGLFVGATPDGSQHLEESFLAAAVHDAATGPGAEQLGQAAVKYLRHAMKRPEQAMPHISTWAAAASVLPEPTEALTVDTACSSSLYAIDIGMRRLRAGSCDIAVCGGTFALTPRSVTLFAKLKGFSPTGGLRSFESTADGTLFSDGAGVVVLKTLERARRDGDRILAVLTGVGASSDGRGKAIYAPNGRGQQLAVERAYQAGPSTTDIGWTIAHGTGTAAGDSVEIATLKEAFGTNAMALTSNKSLIGHTGWAAGVLSVIHAVLALQHGRIPSQRPFPTPPAREIPPSFAIPKETLPWKESAAAPRVTAVNSFGFGGTNAHAVISEHQPSQRSRPRAELDDPVVMVGWYAALPGNPSQQHVSDWLTGSTPPPGPTEFEAIPAVPFRMLKLPPHIHQALDPAQRLALLAADGLHEQLGRFWATYKDTAGVFTGHSGLTTRACQYTLRCALDDLQKQVAGPLETTSPAAFAAFVTLAEQARQAVDPAAEDSYPGGMPGLIPARIAAALDFHGLVMTTDAGGGSGIEALRLACDYLRTGSLDFALAVAVNANTLTAWNQVVRATLGPDAKDLAQGAVCFALTRQSLAEQAGIEVLARLPHQLDVTNHHADTVTPISLDKRSYLGADSAFTVLAQLLTGRSGNAHWADPLTGSTTTLPLEVLSRPQADRYHVDYWPIAAKPTARTTRALPKECVILTNAPEALSAMSMPERTAVLAVVPGGPPGTQHVQHPASFDIQSALSALTFTPRHLRILAHAESGKDTRERLLALHDLAFLTVKEISTDLTSQSCAIMLYDAVVNGLPVADAGLFTGFAKSLACDLPECDVLCLLTETSSASKALTELDSELATRRTLPVVLRRAAGERLEQRALRAELELAGRRTELDSASVVVAVGGSRGITAVLLKHLAETTRPRIWVLGSSDIGDSSTLPAGMNRAAYIRHARSSSSTTSIAAASEEYERLAALQDSHTNLQLLTDHCGQGRVTYAQCDVRDEAAVQTAIDRIVATDQHIDLLLFAAGANRPGKTRRKNINDFRLVRDIKALGHAHLMRALEGRHPTRWINFGSIAGFAGQPGELDYAAANEYIATAAAQAQAKGLDHVTIGWPVWKETGLVSDPIVQHQLARIGLGAISNGEGTQLFRRELTAPAQPPYTVLLTKNDQQIVDSRFPGLFDAATDPPQLRDTVALGLPLVGVPELVADGTAVFDCRIDTTADGYLTDHLVDGRPTVPGTFLVEMGVEAACALHPLLTPSKILDGTYTRFLRAHPRTGTTVFRITARSTAAHPGEIHVAITISADIRTPSGKLVAPDQIHTTCTVVLAEHPQHPDPNLPNMPVTQGAVPDPYYLDNGSIILRGPFVTTSHTAFHDGLAYGRFAPPSQLPQQPFSAFRTPALLLDGLARISVLHTLTRNSASVFALKGFRQVTLHLPGSDHHADRASKGPIHLYSIREEKSGRAEESSYRCIAVDDEKVPVIEVSGLRGYLKGAAQI